MRVQSIFPSAPKTLPIAAATVPGQPVVIDSALLDSCEAPGRHGYNSAIAVEEKFYPKTMKPGTPVDDLLNKKLEDFSSTPYGQVQQRSAENWHNTLTSTLAGMKNTFDHVKPFGYSEPLSLEDVQSTLASFSQAKLAEAARDSSKGKLLTMASYAGWAATLATGITGFALGNPWGFVCIPMGIASGFTNSCGSDLVSSGEQARSAGQASQVASALAGAWIPLLHP